MWFKRHLRLRKWPVIALAAMAIAAPTAAQARPYSDYSDNGTAPAVRHQAPANPVVAQPNDGFNWGSSWMIAGFAGVGAFVLTASVGVARTRGRLASS